MLQCVYRYFGILYGHEVQYICWGTHRCRDRGMLVDYYYQYGKVAGWVIRMRLLHIDTLSTKS